MTTAIDILREYADALRGDWGSIDGRSEKIHINKLADVIAIRGGEPLVSGYVRRIRDDMNLCLKGGGHWQNYCEDDTDYCEFCAKDRLKWIPGHEVRDE